jgi:hypothetical protein
MLLTKKQKELHLLRSTTLQRLGEIQQMSDKEAAHSMADEILCELLNKLGFEDVVKEYDKIEKLYA